jgi:hypothetical protein
MPDTMSDPIQLTADAQTERAKVESWRLHVLIEAGYPLRLAEQLAVAETVDLHQAVELVTTSGCAHATAADILL